MKYLIFIILSFFCLKSFSAIVVSNPKSLKEAVLNGGLIERISIAEGSPGAMPEGGPRLPQNDINAIIQWNAEGLLE